MSFRGRVAQISREIYSTEVLLQDAVVKKLFQSHGVVHRERRDLANVFLLHLILEIRARLVFKNQGHIESIMIRNPIESIMIRGGGSKLA